jgi:hypothetical protein
LGQLQLLEEKGATVTPLGTSTVDGATVSGYSVTISQAQEQENLQQEIQSGAIPQSLVPTMQQELQKLGTPTVDVSIDGSDVLRQMSFSITGGSSGASSKVAMTFDDYGTPVTVSPPASDDVISFTQFLQDAQVPNGSGGPGG